MKKEKKDKHFIKKPVYPGGITAMREFIANELQYPKEALELGKEGTVRLRYDIDYKGKVTEVFILGGLGYGCDEEAERIVRKLKFHVDKNHKVKVVFHKDIQIHFRLPKVKTKPPQKQQATNITRIEYTYSTTSNATASSQSKGKTTSYSYTINVPTRKN